MRRQRGRPINGWLIIDKPPGMTSTDVVNRVRRGFDAQKAGHGGTLDPLATGVLPIALGEATKTVPFLMDADKTYRFTIAWGTTTARQVRIRGRERAVAASHWPLGTESMPARYTSAI